ncbi:zinc ribbon domain-containing protein, partial [Frankia sp. R82]
MSAAFDGSGYRQRVLAPLRASSSVETADPFLIAGLDPTVSHTDSEVSTHLVRVLAFLQRERNSAKYATLATELVRRRAEWEEPLREADSREQIRARVLSARRSGDAERLAKVDGYLATVRERFGGIPASRVEGLRRLAAAAGVSAAEFDARLGREQLIVDGVGGGIEPLPSEVRRQIAQRLGELRALRGGDRVSSASLWAFLGLTPDASPERLRAAHAAVAAANNRRPHDREKTVTADLLALVWARLIEGDPAAYTVGLLADAADELRPAVEEHVVLDGELTAVAFEGLVRAALATGRGLTAAQAKSVVLGVTRELGAAVNVGGVVDYVVCPGCGRPEAAGTAQHCRYCDTDLYTTCPSCGTFTEAAAVVCRHCGHSLRQAKEAAEALAAVRRALEGGQPRTAGELLAAAHPVLVAVGGPVAGAAEELGGR